MSDNINSVTFVYWTSRVGFRCLAADVNPAVILTESSYSLIILLTLDLQPLITVMLAYLLINISVLASLFLLFDSAVLLLLFVWFSVKMLMNSVQKSVICYFGEPLTFPQTLLWGWYLWFTVKNLNTYWMDCCNIILVCALISSAPMTFHLVPSGGWYWVIDWVCSTSNLHLCVFVCVLHQVCVSGRIRRWWSLLFSHQPLPEEQPRRLRHQRKTYCLCVCGW